MVDLSFKFNFFFSDARYSNTSLHQTIYSNIPPASSIGYVGPSSSVAVISAETPLYSNVRTIEAPGMTYGEQLIHNSRHGIISQRKFFE